MTSAALINHEQHIPDVLRAFAEAHARICKTPLDGRLHHLVKLRASQINECAFCVKMHNAEARKDGETADRLERLVVWRHVDDFTDAERAALAWTEALTRLDDKEDYGRLRADLQQHFTDEEISAITAAAAMINLWNRIGISNH
ncbi:carboxymuconolactone decarboxylase family protein [Roseibium aggregatum]|uniref:Carboxymuconolactone decarboxylase family protein n=1 Tax=Roseibium aggregatum TaxID=187304 RepID=A0A926P3N1_9HYPH|nr:carboxymuconolactone decarboxylase family protein [Roseibium aggregatum]MBD1549080.1 carboxymuconolactone decarboxylase family protein [Roseibium aggregatum]